MKAYREMENYMVLPEALEQHYGGSPDRERVAQAERNAFTETERRLYALPILQDRIEDNREELQELESCGAEALRHSSVSVVRYLRPGIRLTPEEAHEAQVSYLRARLAADEREVKKLRAALQMVSGDPYYPVLEMKYHKNMREADIAEELKCDPTTARRNRSRLVKLLALRLYGTPYV